MPTETKPLMSHFSAPSHRSCRKSIIVRHSAETCPPVHTLRISRTPISEKRKTYMSHTLFLHPSYQAHDQICIDSPRERSHFFEARPAPKSFGFSLRLPLYQRSTPGNTAIDCKFSTRKGLIIRAFLTLVAWEQQAHLTTTRSHIWKTVKSIL